MSVECNDRRSSRGIEIFLDGYVMSIILVEK